MTITPSRFIQRYDTSTNWNILSTTLYAGELGFSYDNSVLKTGDNNSSWSTLTPINLTPSNLHLVDGVLDPATTISNGSIFAYYYGDLEWVFSAGFVSIDPITFDIDYSINNFDDVDISTTPLVDGDILIWNTLNSKWFNSSVVAIGIESNTAPASSSDTGIIGEIRYDANYIYVCVATNTWKRFNLVAW